MKAGTFLVRQNHARKPNQMQSDFHLEKFIYSFTRIFLLVYIINMKTILNALAEPNRLHIVELLRDGPMTVGEITDKLGLNQPQVSKHLRVLSENGLVEVQPIANRRYYKLRAEPFQEMDSWIESYRHLWNERLDRLDEYLKKLQGKDGDETNNE
jgi:DNA-binding transcriptional ArsR family regulator